MDYYCYRHKTMIEKNIQAMATKVPHYFLKLRAGLWHRGRNSRVSQLDEH